MKKLLIALLAVLMCLSLVACGEPSETTGGDVETTGGVVDGTGSVTPGTDGPGSVETEEPEDTETLSVGVDNATEFGPINQ